MVNASSSSPNQRPSSISTFFSRLFGRRRDSSGDRVLRQNASTHSLAASHNVADQTRDEDSDAGFEPLLSGALRNPNTPTTPAASSSQDIMDDDDPANLARSTLASPLPRQRFSTAGASDPAEASVFEIMARLDAIDPQKAFRPTHRTGVLGLCGARIDSAHHHADMFLMWDRRVTQLRKVPETSPATSVGFVTFDRPESAIIASQINLASRPFACMTRMAPEPRDLFWPNLSSRIADPYIKVFRSVFVYTALFFMIFFNTVIVSAIASFINLESLALWIPGLKDVIDQMDPVVKQFVQGVIPTAVLAFWTSSLPSLLLILSELQGLEAQSWIEMSVMSKYFFYQLWNILFVVVVSSTVIKSAGWPIQTPRDVIEILGNSLPQESPTLINYTILIAFASYPAQLLCAGPLLLTWIIRLSPWSSLSPRSVSSAYYPSLLTSINYGIAYPVPILLWVIGIVYAPIAPIICPFIMIFFTIAFFVYKYLLLYVHIPRYESGGLMAPMAVRRCLAGMIVMQATMMGTLALKSVAGSDRPRDYAVVTSSASENWLSSKALGGIGTNVDGASWSWSGYVSMVLALTPLLFLTTGIF
ncbi:hypothetical protein HK102_000404, partial [Quaeritorhiza haematococci]